MLKKTPKYFFALILIISAIIFLESIITHYLVTIGSGSWQIQALIFIAAALVFGSLLTYGLYTFLPVFADIMATLRRMLRYESLSNPVLLRLSTDAPGTYHHSLNVSVLAQKAAKSIGADSLLVRVAAYYHDLGKLSNPLEFVENQAGLEIPTAEDAESISKNAEKIISHVKNGVKIAQEYNMPEEIINLISEHHGTTRALYFYGIAKEKGLKIKKTDFRYQGPKPQSKESAILMLADCVEATARATQNLTPEKISEIIGSSIKERLSEKQFISSGISEKELLLIKNSLEETLLSIYHQRIEYAKG